ncbi:MAG: glycosyltransferase [Solirubrobacterales bacterium]|nr:glycosyltransferase [Solirubrobacterales bacterium]MBV9716648.1 glycosyltransferase [Solirubrobacterales bacterium]
MRILLWHVHGSWTTAFVHGSHEYLLPVLPGRGPDGRGRARTWAWPSPAIEITPEELADTPVDVVLLQRPEEEAVCERWLGGRRPGIDIPAVYVEHNAPQGRIAHMRHPVADRPELTLVHVTHFNDLFWDAGATPTRVIEHGVVDPGYRYTGELARCAVAINEPVRRGRVTGTDLLARFSRAAPLDLYGMGTGGLGGVEDPPQEELHREMPRRRLYLHPIRWTSLGLSLIEAMLLGMPVVALATTEAPDAVPPQAGVLSTDVERLCAEIRRLIRAPEEARERGIEARHAALARYSLRRFLQDWDHLLSQATGLRAAEEVSA